MGAVQKQELQWKPRRWSGHWLNCFGDCNAPGWQGCCLTYWLPWVAFGCNARKVLQKCFWLEALKYVLVLGLVGLAIQVVDVVETDTCDPLLADAKEKVQDKPLTPAAEQQAEALLAAYQACTARFFNYNLACYAVGIVCLLIWAVFVGGRRRRQMREALGIAVTDPRGSCCSDCHTNSDYCNSDCCLHFWCTTCALCQETRTILEAEREQREANSQVAPDGYMPLIVAPAKERAMARCDSAKDSCVAGEKLLPV